MSEHADSPRLFVGGLPTHKACEKWEIEAVFAPYGDVSDVWVAMDPPGYAFVEFADVRSAEVAMKALDHTQALDTTIRIERTKAKGSNRGGRGAATGRGRGDRGRGDRGRGDRGRGYRSRGDRGRGDRGRGRGRGDSRGRGVRGSTRGMDVCGGYEGGYTSYTDDIIENDVPEEEPERPRLYVGDLTQEVSKPDMQELFQKYGDVTDVWISRDPIGFAFVEFSEIYDAKRAMKELDGTSHFDSTLKIQLTRGKKGYKAYTPVAPRAGRGPGRARGRGPGTGRGRSGPRPSPYDRPPPSRGRPGAGSYPVHDPFYDDYQEPHYNGHDPHADEYYPEYPPEHDPYARPLGDPYADPYYAEHDPYPEYPRPVADPYAEYPHATPRPVADPSAEYPPATPRPVADPYAEYPHATPRPVADPYAARRHLPAHDPYAEGAPAQHPPATPRDPYVAAHAVSSWEPLPDRRRAPVDPHSAERDPYADVDPTHPAPPARAPPTDPRHKHIPHSAEQPTSRPYDPIPYVAPSRPAAERRPPASVREIVQGVSERLKSATRLREEVAVRPPYCTT